MNESNALPRWLQLLSGSLDTEYHCHFPQSAVEPAENLIAPITYYGFLQTVGPDTLKFLQGQATCDFRDVAGEHSLPGCFCTPKGRAYSSFLASITDPGRVLKRLRRDVVVPTKDRLGKYMVFSKAEQSELSESIVAVGLSGPSAAKNITAVFANAPAGKLSQVHSPVGTAIQLDDAGQLFECWINIDQIEGCWSSLSQGLTLQGSRSWELLSIRRGDAQVSAATIDEFVPQMLDFHTTGAVSFTKGCYTGQEVIARMHYKGSAKRQLYRIRSQGTLEPGAALIRPDTEQSIGTVVNAVALDEESGEALAVIAIKEVDERTAISDENAHPVEVLSLPYAITK